MIFYFQLLTVEFQLLKIYARERETCKIFAKIKKCLKI